MQPIYNSALQDFLPNQWINWCRLCAKEDTEHNINFLCHSEEEHLKHEIKKLSIREALAKYFCLQISIEDALPKTLCTNCLSLVSSITNFNERVQRVQLMFLHLAEEQQRVAKCLDLNAVRVKFDVTEAERDHRFNSKYLLGEMEKKRNDLTINKNKKLPPADNDDGFDAKIKLEYVENLTAMDYDEYMEEDGVGLEKEKMVFNDNANELLTKEEQDPFHHNDKKENSSSDEEETEQEYQKQSQLHNIESNVPKSKLDRGKKKRKRKKLKQFSSLDCKKKKSAIKDFKMVSTCKACGKNFTKYILYREHMQQEHDCSSSDKHWPCPVCDKVLLSLYNLERHVRIHVPLEARQTIQCSECDNRYTTNAQLETHIRYKHKNEKPFICEECGLCLRTNSNLRQHMLIHTDIAPFECEVCKKKFKNKTRLKTHMDIHSPNKHMCNICGLQLNSRATLNRHFLVHSDEMQHKCDYCGKAFKRAKALKNHLLLHTGLKPYSCDFCERTFANGSNCRSHMKKVHPDELAVLEASGNKTHTKNIPKLETLKAVTKAADNLTPVVTKFSGCFAFGKKPKNLDINLIKQTQKSQNKVKKQRPLQNNNNDDEQLAFNSCNSAPLDLQYVANASTNSSSCLPEAKNLENSLSTSATRTNTPIPNFDNIYQHLLKQNQTDCHNKRPLSQISPQTSATGSVNTSHHNPFYEDIAHSINPPSLQRADDLLHSPESPLNSISSTTALTQDDHSNVSLIQESFYGTIRTNFM